MALDPQTLLQHSRGELAAMARQAGVTGADTLTRTELADELLRLSVTDSARRRRLRGWFGTARDMLASLVERGLNLPDAAALIRGDAPAGEFRWQPPLATITLAKIYDAQGYRQRALDVLEDVLKREPEHAVALRMKSQWAVVVPAVVSPAVVSLASDAQASDAPAQASDAAVRRPDPSPALALKNETATFTSVGPTRALFLWDLDERRFAASGGARAGHLTLTVAAFCTLPDGTRLSQRVIDLDGASGQIEIQALPAGAVLRSCISWQFAGRTQILRVCKPSQEDARTRAELTDPSDPITIVRPTKAGEPSKPSEASKMAEASKLAEPSKPNETTEPSKPAEPSKTEEAAARGAPSVC